MVVTSNPAFAERLYMAQDGSCSVWPETGPMSEAFFCGGNFRGNELNAAVLRVQTRRLDGILSKLRLHRQQILDRLRLPAGVRVVPTHDEDGTCAVCFLLQARDVPMAERLESELKPLLSVHRPIHSGRHVYSAWDVIKSKRGGHHPDWDCFRHPRNAKIKVDYDRPLKQSDDLLSRTVLCATPYGLRASGVRKLVREMNEVMDRTAG